VAGSTVSRSLMREGRMLAREEYTFPAAVQVDVQQLDAPTHLALSVAAEPTDALNRSDSEQIEPGTSPISLHVEAFLGRDLRFLRGSDRE
jgi:hypothetical protein